MNEFIREIVELNEDQVMVILKKKLEENEAPLAILNEIKEAMKVIGEKFSNKEYFLPDLIMSGEILRNTFELLGPRLKSAQEQIEKQGKVLLGTVAGDIHDIGKDVVKFMLDANGFDVLDLGVDVPVNKFIESLKEFKPEVLALSGFLTLAFDSMKETIDAIKEAGLRNDVKIMIGGGTIDERIVEYVGADAFGESAVEAVSIATKWVGGD